ncbi:MAG TPA: peptidase [bacterium]|nr:peptidase [bacterium]
MTFCIAMKVKEGLVALADTRITSGMEQITARKVSVHQNGNHSFFLMTSGLRSARDKALTYFEEKLEASWDSYDKLYKAVNIFSEQVRRVIHEDKKALEEAGYHFNLYSIVGGQLSNDAEHKLYLVYPQGNWVEVTESTPYYAIGESAYGKPLIDRALHYESSMELAMKLGYLAFEATRTSATDVDFPIDMVLYRKGTYKMLETRYEREDLANVTAWWKKRVRETVELCPADWAQKALQKLPEK